jgi:integrase
VLPTDEQWQRVVDYLRERAGRVGSVEARHQFLLVLWLAGTGMRPSAATALKIGDVDFERGTVRLSGEFAKNGRTAILPVGQKALAAAAEAAAGRPKGERVFLCVSARYALLLASRFAGLKISHSTLRKLFATRALEAGVAPAIAARLLTHQDGGQTLLKHYAQWRDAALLDAVGRMDAAPAH